MNSAVMVMAFSDQLVGASARKCARNGHLAVSIDTRLNWMEDPELELPEGSLRLAFKILIVRMGGCRWLG
jgi:hypothetical protein